MNKFQKRFINSSSGLVLEIAKCKTQNENKRKTNKLMFERGIHLRKKVRIEKPRIFASL
jgi:hypothetical protein